MATGSASEPRRARASPRRLARERGEFLYVESSAILRVLLERDAGLTRGLRQFARFFTSALTLIEVPRAIARAQREGRLSQPGVARVRRRFRAFARSCAVAEITAPVRDRASAEFPIEPVRSLDAIHLASVLVWTDALGPVVVASCDDRIRENARVLGYEVVPKAL